MIKNLHDEKVTPKRFAQDILMDKISLALGYWLEDGTFTDGLTTREKNLVSEQLKKQADRVAKMFGYKEAWYS